MVIANQTGYTTTQQQTAGEIKALGFTTKADNDALYIKKDELENNIKQVTTTPKYVGPATWDAIVIDEIKIEKAPYITYQSGVESIERPNFVIQKSNEGIFGGILGKFTGQKSAGIDIPYIKDIQKDIVDLKTGEDSLFNGINSIMNKPNTGLVDIINRHERVLNQNMKFSSLLRLDLLRTVNRTDSLNSKIAELSSEIQGVRVIAGQGTPIETVRSEIERISKGIATTASYGAVEGIFNDTIFPNNASDWFGRKLATFNIPTASSMAGWSDVKGVFSSNGALSSVKLGRATLLIENSPGIISGLGDNFKSFNALFKDQFNLDGNTFYGLVSFAKDGIANWKPGSVVGEIADSEFTKRDIPMKWKKLDYETLAGKLAGVYPFSQLKGFFRNLVTSKGYLDGVGGAYDRISGRYKSVTDMFNKLKDGLHLQEYTISYSLTVHDITNYSSTALSEYKKKGILGLIAGASADVKASADYAVKNAKTTVLDSEKNRAMAEAERDVLKKIMDEYTTMLKKAITPFNFVDLDSLKTPDFSKIGWDGEFNLGLNKIFETAKLLPTKVPDGWA